MESAIRWTGKAFRLCLAHPWAALRCAGMLLLPALLWSLLFVYLYEFSPWSETLATASLGLQFVISTAMAAIFMPFISGTYSAAYGFAMDGEFHWKDYWYGLSTPHSAVLSFLGMLFVTFTGLFFFGGASVVWVMPLQAVSDKRFPANFRFSIYRTTRNITTLLHAMGVMLWITILGLIPIGIFSLCWMLFEKAGDFLATLMVLVSPILMLAWMFFPFVILVQAVGVRDELALQDGPFKGRLKESAKKEILQSPVSPVRPIGKSRAVDSNHCPVCGEEVPRQARFCPSCRSPVSG